MIIKRPSCCAARTNLIDSGRERERPLDRCARLQITVTKRIAPFCEGWWIGTVFASYKFMDFVLNSMDREAYTGKRSPSYFCSILKVRLSTVISPLRLGCCHRLLIGSSLNSPILKLVHSKIRSLHGGHNFKPLKTLSTYFLRYR